MIPILVLFAIYPILGLEVMYKAIEFLFFILPIGHIPLVVKRFHDIGLSGKYYIFLSIASLVLVSKSNPILIYISILLGLFLLFKKGDLEGNKYGLPMGRNKYAKWILIGIFISSILVSVLYSTF